MDIKARLENVLHCYLLDEQVEYIKEYYKTFYENPESYQNDGLVDIIIDDVGLTRIEPWSTTVNESEQPINPWDSVEAADNIEIKKIFPSGANAGASDVSSLAIGHVNHIPVYFRMLTNISAFNYIGWTASYQHIADLNNKLHDYPNAQILRIYRIGTTNPTGYYVAYAYKAQYINELNDVHQCGKDDWEYVGDYPMTEDCRPACRLYVPFSEMANGGRIPVMWFDPIGTVSAINVMATEKLMHLSDVSEDDIHDIYNDLKNEYSSIDLESHDDKDRYAVIRMGDNGDTEVFIYNRNHIARNGAIAHGMATIPLLLSKEQRMMGPHHSSLYTILEQGSHGESAYIKVYGDEVQEELERNSGEQMTYPSGKDRSQYESREYLDNSGSRIQQLLNQGTGDYKEANLNE